MPTELANEVWRLVGDKTRITCSKYESKSSLFSDLLILFITLP